MAKVMLGHCADASLRSSPCPLLAPRWGPQNLISRVWHAIEGLAERARKTGAPRPQLAIGTNRLTPRWPGVLTASWKRSVATSVW